MNSLNIRFLAEVEDPQVFSEYENALSGRKIKENISQHEQESLISLIKDLIPLDIPLNFYDGFFFSFTIAHISKEFDLIKIAKDKSKILNIELKSQPIDLKRIQKQLIQNQSHLRHISEQIESFTYISSSSEVYYLDDSQTLQKKDIYFLGAVLQKFDDYMSKDIESLFRARDFLVSPMNTPDKFLKKQYFLTDQQEKYEKELLTELIRGTGAQYFGITGGPGTGKTLLLYDIACEISRNGKVCIIHCGILSPGHRYLDKQLTEVSIKPIRDISPDDLSVFDSFSFILVDEVQRIYKNQFDSIADYVKKKNIKCIFSYDSQQTLSANERDRDIPTEIGKLCGKKLYKLSSKIRTNKELSTFIKAFLDLKKRDKTYEYASVDILFAKDHMEAFNILKYYEEDYTFINYTPSKFVSYTLDVYGENLNTHQVIGQEYDNVVMILDNTFFYDANGILCAKTHPNPDYLYRKLLFQGISRTRECLCLIVVGDIDLFRKINEIKIHRLP